MWRKLVDRLNHEYWPWQLIYLPIWPCYVYQAVRQRRAAFFTNVNPAIDMGGFFGEGKSAIYDLLPVDAYPRTMVVPPRTPAAQLSALRSAAGIEFPLIVKPDVGERGQGVVRVTDEAGLLQALADKPQALLMQALAQGAQEYGLMFARDVVTNRVELLSVCGKRFLSVVGDGTHTTRWLLAETWRGSKQIARLAASSPQVLEQVPARGEVLLVEPIGNHCRGTLFFNAGHVATDRLRQRLDAILNNATGINYGRLDVRSESEEALALGSFVVIELNGVSSEPGHIYDPSWSIFRCWSELLRHVRKLGPLSLAAQRAGHQPVSLYALVVRCEAHFGWRLGLLRRIAAVFA